jgi:hypothetical protein
MRFTTEDEKGNLVEFDDDGLLRIWSDGDRMAGAYMKPEQIEALAIALVQATPGDDDGVTVRTTRFGDEPVQTICLPTDVGMLRNPQAAIRLGLALIRAAGRVKDERVLVHADGGACHGTRLRDGRCPACGIAPDMQSTELWPPGRAK